MARIRFSSRFTSRWLSGLAFMLGLAASEPTRAQAPAAPSAAPASPNAPASGQPLPAGHPPVAGGSPAAGPLPPGHPMVGSAAGGDEGSVPQDSSESTSSLPSGAVEIKIVNPDEQPRANEEVRLGILHQTVAEGEARETKTARTNAAGIVQFTGLNASTEYSYRVTVPAGPATYAVAPFQFRAGAGQRVTLHVFPVTRDIRSALLGMRGIIAVEPRDDVFQFEVMYRVFNVGKVTWVPSDVVLELPPGAKGFNAQEGMDDTRFTAESPTRVRLTGTFSPGQHDTVFRFQIPNSGDANVSFRMTVPPHVADMRVIAQSAPGMELTVDGFEPAEPTVDNNGQRLLFASKQLRAGDAQLRDLSITLSGLPTQGPGQWIAVALAAGFALWGIAAARRSPAQPKRLPAEDAARAREVLINELVALERARRDEQIGPSTYEATRRQLLQALGRLQTAAAAPPAPATKRSAVEAAATSPS